MPCLNAFVSHALCKINYFLIYYKMKSTKDKWNGTWGSSVSKAAYRAIHWASGTASRAYDEYSRKILF